MPVNVAELVEEIDRLKEEQRVTTYRIKKLNELVLLYADERDVPAPVVKDAPKKKRRRWPTSAKQPTSCVIPSRYHEAGSNMKVVAFGLCQAHVHKERRGTMSEEEFAAFQTSLDRLNVEYVAPS